MNKKNAQTATEYLIILAVVIIIALIVVAIIGRGTDVAGGTGDSVGTISWQNAPGVAVMGVVFSDSNEDSITLRNNVGSQPITILNITITPSAGSPVVIMNDSTPVQIGAGQQRVIANSTVSGGIQTADFACSTGFNAGDRYSYGLSIRYREDNSGAIRTTTNNDARLEGSCAE